MKTILSMVMLFVLIGITGHSQDSIVGKCWKFPQIKENGIDTVTLYYRRPGDCVLSDSVIARDRREFSQRFMVVRIKKSNFWHKVFNEKLAVSSSAMFSAGMFSGVNQTLEYHYSAFKAVFPHCNDRFWNPANNTQNNNGVYTLRNTVLEPFYDGRHSVQLCEHINLALAVVFPLADKFKWRDWYIYLVDGVIDVMAYDLGFMTTYNGIFKSKK
jgi:hypothetical protein